MLAVLGDVLSAFFRCLGADRPALDEVAARFEGFVDTSSVDNDEDVDGLLALVTVVKKLFCCTAGALTTVLWRVDFLGAASEGAVEPKNDAIVR